MSEQELTVKDRLKQALRVELAENIAEIERTCQTAGPLISRAEVLRGIKCCVPECIARSVRKEQERGAPIDREFLRVAVEAFNEVLDELAAQAVN